MTPAQAEAANAALTKPNKGGPAPAPTQAETLALRDAFVAAGRELFDALDAFALAAGGVPYDRYDVKVDLDGLCAGMVENAGGDVLGPGDAPALAVGYETYPYDAWATPEALADAVAAKVRAAEEWAAACRETSQREVVASARRTLEAAGYAVSAPNRDARTDPQPGDVCRWTDANVEYTVRARTADGVEVKRVLGPDRFGRYDITVLTLSLTDWGGHAAASWTAP